MMNSFVPVLVLNLSGFGLEDKISKNAGLGLEKFAISFLVSDESISTTAMVFKPTVRVQFSSGLCRSLLNVVRSEN